MKRRPAGRASSSEKIIRDIKRKTRKQYSAEEKIRIVLDGLRVRQLDRLEIIQSLKKAVSQEKTKYETQDQILNAIK